jgi:GTP pyrophosphokinase
MNEEAQEIKKFYRDLLRFAYRIASKQELKRLRLAYGLILENYNFTREKEAKDEIRHAVEVAKIVAEEEHLGIPSIIGALLHNLVLEKKLSLVKVKKLFGVQVQRILEDYRILSDLDTSKIEYHSEKFLSMHLAIVKDFRAILIRLAHRLFDMRVLSNYDEKHQQKIINEVEYIYIPIVHRLGLYHIKSDLENLWLEYTHPREYIDIARKLKESKKKQDAYIQEFIRPIEQELYRRKFDFTIKSRTKSIYSIWRKIKTKNVSFEEVYDLFAIRIILNSKGKKEKTDCWRAYSIVTDIYTPEPRRLRDWISNPKASGYESLHTTVLGSANRWVEVQIRTKRMDDIAENGLAAHWIYKEGGKKKEQERWLGNMKSLLVKAADSKEGLPEDQKMGMDSKEVFVFTPEGDLKKLPKGSSVLDFAYSIHTSLGEMCTGARINNKHVPIRYKLQSGDRVEIITSKNQSPSLDWLNYTATPRAKAKIKRALNEEKLREAEFGKELLRRRLKNNKIQLDDVLINRLVKEYKLTSSTDLYYFIALQKIDIKDIKQKLEIKDTVIKNTQERSGVAKDEQEVEDAFMIGDADINNLGFELANCCKPVSGDAVFGFVTVGKGVVIHRVDCPNAAQLLNKYQYRVVDVKWRKTDENRTYLTTLNIFGLDGIGILSKITDVISKNLRVNMQNMWLDAKKEGVFVGHFTVSVKDKKHLDNLMFQLRKIQGVKKVKREVFIEN